MIHDGKWHAWTCESTLFRCCFAKPSAFIPTSPISAKNLRITTAIFKYEVFLLIFLPPNHEGRNIHIRLKKFSSSFCLGSLYFSKKF